MTFVAKNRVPPSVPVSSALGLQEQEEFSLRPGRDLKNRCKPEWRGIRTANSGLARLETERILRSTLGQISRRRRTYYWTSTA